MLRPIICAITVIGVALPTHGAIINVGPGQSIQNAINIAANGDTIVVAPGTYNEAIDFLGKAVTLRSSGGPGNTVIDATGLDSSVVTCDSSEDFSTVLDGFTITGGTGTFWLTKYVGGGMINSWAEPTVRNCVFAQNSADEGGAMWNRGKDPMIAGCKFVGNSTTSFGIGGGAMFNQLADPTIVDCVFTGNASANFGGAIYNLAASPLVVNSLFYENTANTLGAAIFANESSSSIINCTFTANTTALNGGGLLCTGSNVSVSNCIFWNNSPDEIYSSSTAVTTVDSSNIMGGWAGPGSNNMDEQPLFVDPTDSDYRLASGSPCIDAGDDTAVPMEITTDLDGNDRLVGQVDLGPYESQVGGGSTCPHDLDGDGSVGITDFLDLLDAWGTDPGGPPDFDGNGSVDMVDFLDLLSNWGPCT